MSADRSTEGRRERERIGVDRGRGRECEARKGTEVETDRRRVGVDREAIPSREMNGMSRGSGGKKRQRGDCCGRERDRDRECGAKKGTEVETNRGVGEGTSGTSWDVPDVGL